MWDLNTIIRENNRVAIEYMMRPPEMEKAEAPIPEAWSLSTLAKKMRIGPPLLQELLKCFSNVEEVMAFVQLVRDYLPEHESDILWEPRDSRVYKFCYLFEKKYFPLPMWSHSISLSNFVVGMPVALMGMSYSAYHDLDFRPGYVLLMSLVVYPYEGDERDSEDDDVPFDPFDPMRRTYMEASFGRAVDGQGKKADWRPGKKDVAWLKNLMLLLQNGGKWIAPMGFTVIKINNRNIELLHADNTPEVREAVHRTVLIAEKADIKVKVRVGETAEEKKGRTLLETFTGGRVPVLEMAQRVVGEGLVMRLPREGWEPKVLHAMTDGTPYDGVGHFADWACQQTGCIVLDSNYEDCEYIEGDGEPIFQWTKRNVSMLAEEWPKVQEYRHKIGKMVDWLEADPHSRFQELLDFIMSLPPSKRRVADPNKKRSMYDPTEHWCPLDQPNPFGEEENEEEQEDGRQAVGAGLQIREITPEEFVDGIDLEDL
jgi:hypothetical protein